MKQKTVLPEELCMDEAVCFIAYRHHVSPQQLLRYFLYGKASIPLEANEVEILKGLLRIEYAKKEHRLQFTPDELADIRRHLNSIEIMDGPYPEDKEKMT